MKVKFLNFNLDINERLIDIILLLYIQKIITPQIIKIIDDDK